MMLLTLDRKYPKPTYTVGLLSVGNKFFGNTLEDVVRDLNHDGDLNDFGEYKVYGETAIPYELYKVIVTYSPKFKRELPLLLDVKHFVGIRIHRGNYAKDTSGCILVGKNTFPGQLSESAKHELRLTTIIKAAIAEGEEVFINII
jgi:hypothetical protein